jgi:hypothetical protein
MPFNPLRPFVQKALSGKEPAHKFWYGTMGIKGSTTGDVTVPGRPGWVYVTLADGLVVEARNVIAPNRQNYRVVVGYDPQQPNKNQLNILGQRNGTIADETENMAYMTPNHHASHEFLNPDGGDDVVWVQKRQIAPLRPMAIYPFGIYIEKDVQVINSTWQQVGGTSVDLTTLQHTCMYSSGSAGDSRMVLITLNLTSGSIVMTAGTIRPLGTLTGADIPAVPAGQLPICAVRLYVGQVAINEAFTGTDIIDLRLALSSASGGSGTLTGSGSPRQVAIWNATTGLTGDPNLIWDSPNGLKIGNYLSVVAGWLALSTYAAVAGEPTIQTQFAQGSPGALSASLAGDDSLYEEWCLYTGSGYENGATFEAKASENWSPTQRGMELIWAANITGGVTKAYLKFLDGNLDIGTGKYKGDGSQLTGISASDADAKIRSWMRI